MSRRSAVVYVGDDTNVRRRVRDAVSDAWSAPRTPTCRMVAPTALASATEEEGSPLADACGIVTTTDALASDGVRNRLASTPGTVPVIAAVEELGVELTRTVIEADADDVVRIRLEVEDQGIPAHRIVAVRGVVIVLDRPVVPRVLAVIENDLLIQLPQVVHHQPKISFTKSRASASWSTSARVL